MTRLGNARGIFSRSFCCLNFARKKPLDALSLPDDLTETLFNDALFQTVPRLLAVSGSDRVDLISEDLADSEMQFGIGDWVDVVITEVDVEG